MIKCTILGCGGSNGVPQIACECNVCLSEEPKNKRTRPSILLEFNNEEYNDTVTLLIDTTPDIREQALRNKIKKIDAILYTHSHFDHVSGIGDLRLLIKKDTVIPTYMDPKTEKVMVNKFSYLFKKLTEYYPSLLYSVKFEDNEEFKFKNIHIKAFIQGHGESFSYGFRFGDMAYSTDVNMLSERALDTLKGVKFWIIDCIRYDPSPTHAHLSLALDWISKINPELAILTSMSHEIDYNEIQKLLPKNVIPGYDGMNFMFNGKK